MLVKAESQVNQMMGLKKGKTPLVPHVQSFIHSNPKENSSKQRYFEDWRLNHKLLKTLLKVVGKISEYDYIPIEERLKKVIKGCEQSALQPKIAS